MLYTQCDNCCVPDDAACPVLNVQMSYNYAQHDHQKLTEAMNLLVNEQGKCMMKPILDGLKVGGKKPVMFRPPMVGDHQQESKEP